MYFYGDTLPIYSDHLSQTEEGQLLRIRWFVDHTLGKNDVVFLELKTHHESWVGIKSINHRVLIFKKYMDWLVDFGSTTGYDVEGHDPICSKELDIYIVS